MKLLKIVYFRSVLRNSHGPTPYLCDTCASHKKTQYNQGFTLGIPQTYKNWNIKRLRGTIFMRSKLYKIVK